jgi:hypothetical protein
MSERAIHRRSDSRKRTYVNHVINVASWQLHREGINQRMSTSIGNESTNACQCNQQSVEQCRPRMITMHEQASGISQNTWQRYVRLLQISTSTRKLLTSSPGTLKRHVNAGMQSSVLHFDDCEFKTSPTHGDLIREVLRHNDACMV